MKFKITKINKSIKKFSKKDDKKDQISNINLKFLENLLESLQEEIKNIKSK